MATLYTNNFDAETVGNTPTGWVNKVGAWVVGTTRPVSGANTFGTGADGNAALYTGISAVADMELSTDHIVVVSGAQLPAPGHVLRCDSAYSNGYLVSFDSVDGATIRYYIFKIVGGAFTALAGPTSTGVSVVAGDTVHLDSKIVGNTISTYVWKNATAKPSTATASIADSTFTAAGYAGLRASAGGISGVTITADNLIIGDAVAVSAATAVTMTGPTSGATGAASTNFTVGANGTITGTVRVTPNDASGGGTFFPTFNDISSGSPTGTFTYTPASAGAKTISVTNNGSLTNPSNITYTASSTSINALTSGTGNVLFSPYTWNIGTSIAATINSGAYFKTIFSGTTCALNFDMTNLVSPFPQIKYRIAGFGPWTTVTIAASVSLTLPTETAGEATKPGRLLEVVVKSTNTTTNRWTAVSSVTLNGITLDAGAVITKPTALPTNSIWYGDSITEGVYTLNAAAGNNTDYTDATLSWAYIAGQILGSEVGIVGFSATGISVAGFGSVPAFPSTYNFLYSGVARSFSPQPDYIVINEGTNDSTTNTVSAMTTILNGLLSATTTTKIIVMRPFNGNQAANLQSAIAACSAPSRCVYIDTTGFFTTANSNDAVHPFATENITHIAPLVSKAVRPYSVTASIQPTATKNISVTFTNKAGAVQASLTGLKWEWQDTLGIVIDSGTGATTNASGVFSVTTVHTNLAAAGVGYLKVTNSSGAVNTTDVSFNGTVAVA